MFRSFFLAGFQGSTGHHRTVDGDYAQLARIGIHTVRECVRWPLIDIGRGKYDFSSLEPIVRAANRQRFDVLWDLSGGGYPEDLDPLGREFQLRFADYCFEAGRYIADHSRSDTCWFAPVRFAPRIGGKPRDLRLALCRAAVAGIEALWVAAPECRIVNLDRPCRIAPLRQAFEVWDIIGGRLLPEIGGSVRHLDIIGIEHDSSASISDLVRATWSRYRHEMVVSTAAPLDEVAGEAAGLLDEDVPLAGVCLDQIPGEARSLEAIDALLRGHFDEVAAERACALPRPSELVRGRGRY